MFIRKIPVLVLILAAMSVSAFSQDISLITMMNDLDKKQTAAYSDAEKLFSAQTKENLSLGYESDKPLTRGMVAKMTAKYLDLRGSLLYNIFGTERYAVRACIAE